MLSLIAGLTSPAPNHPPNPVAQLHHLNIFQNSTIHPSIGDKALCISGTIQVHAAANNTLFNLAQPANQTVLTNLLVQFTQINSTLAQDLSLGPNAVNETFDIYSQLCFPKDAPPDADAKALQFLIHGGHFGHTYWSPAPGYSYIDYAASKGYPTFSYDRLGVGHSSRPDPIQTVQTPIQVSIAHQLLTILRKIHNFDKIIGVGHSYGSAQIAALTPSYPEDLDAVVLTGAVAEPNGQIYDDISSVPTIASEAVPERFGALPSGYYVSGPISGLQYGFFRAPGFDPRMLALAQQGRETQTVGELLNFGEIRPSVDFMGAVFVLVGENDVPNCRGDCLVPHDKAARVKGLLYPNASEGSGYHVLSGVGHGINYHYAAEEAYGLIHDFLEKNGL